MSDNMDEPDKGEEEDPSGGEEENPDAEGDEQDNSPIPVWTTSPTHTASQTKSILRYTNTNPNGMLSASRGDIALDNATGTMWINTDGGVEWVPVSNPTPNFMPSTTVPLSGEVGNERVITPQRGTLDVNIDITKFKLDKLAIGDLRLAATENGLVIENMEGKRLATIKKDGKIDFPVGVDLDDLSRKFWKALEAWNPAVQQAEAVQKIMKSLEGQLNVMRAELQMQMDFWNLALDAMGPEGRKKFWESIGPVDGQGGTDPLFRIVSVLQKGKLLPRKAVPDDAGREGKPI